MQESSTKQGHIIIDAACPLASLEKNWLRWVEGGATAIAPTVNPLGEMLAGTMAGIGAWFRRLWEYPDKLLHVTEVADIHRAREEGKMGVIFHFQGSLPIERNLDNIELYQRLGVRMIQLCYNVRDLVGDGCAEDGNAGLSAFGRAVVKELNRVGIVVDCAHTGRRTTLEAIELSDRPVVVSHGNAKAVCESVRNIDDEVIKAVARSGGIVGLNGHPAFIVPDTLRPTQDQLIEHAIHIAELVGVDHVGLGIDYFRGMSGVVSDEQALAVWEGHVASGLWDPRHYPRPPIHYPQGMETPEGLSSLADSLARRGFDDQEVAKIMGLNWMRVFEACWQ